MHLVTVFASSITAEIIVAKLVLQSEGVPFITEGEGVQDLVGLGRAFGGVNLVTGPIRLRVTESDAELARQLLNDLRSPTDTPEPAPEDGP